MSDSKDSGKSDAIHFSWGRKGGQNKEVQFYKSFTYDGVEYSLYDCVYALKEGEGKPYIGKLIKIWELKNKQRKVKLLWFFYPEEISNFLEGESMLENELFLATGVGKGLTNINPLEVIAGKCNVICISKDERNRKPSDEEFKMADHVFYRTFNVQDHTISDKLGEKIAMIDVNFLLNKNDIQSRDLSKVDSRDIFVGLKKDDEGAISLLDKSEAHSMGNVDAAGADKIDPVMLVRNLINKDPGGSDKDGEYRVSEGLLILNDDKGSKEKGDVTPGNLGSVALPATKVAHTSCQSPKLRSLDSEHSDVQEKCVMIPTENGATQNFELCGFVDLMIEKAINYGLQDSGKYNIDDLVPPVNATDDRKSEIMRDSDISTGVVENVKFKARPLKKLKIDDTAPLFSDNVGNNTQNYGTGGSRKALQSVGTAIEPNDKGRVTKYCNGTSNGLPKKLKKGFTEDESDLKHIKESVNQSKDEQGTAAAYIAINKASLPDIAIDDAEVAGKVKSNIQDKSNEKLCKVLIKESKGVEAEAFGCVKEVTQRPHDRSKWFTASPWEERMKEAHDQGRLVLLQNLDATYTSSEVEDIVWHGFGESCTAKVVQRTATSNHFSAKALVIFKTREVAEKIVSKLDKECLMLPNSRPLLGSREVCFPEKRSPFPGHLVIDKLRHQKHRESREAVSTSHSSQSHTLEYEMAIEWCLLQHRSELWWNMLHKRQAEDIKKLKACLKSEMI